MSILREVSRRLSIGYTRAMEMACQETRRFAIGRTPLGRLVVVRVSGDIDLATVGRLEDEVEDLYGRGYKRIGFDLSDVYSIGSTGLRLLSDLDARLNKKGGGIVIVAASRTVRRVFRILGLQHILPTERPVSPFGMAIPDRRSLA